MNAIPFEAPDLEQLSRLLPQYEFRRFMAQGGMGAVYLAVQRGLEREVAIKVLPRELGADAAFHASFVAEARAMAKLNHPNLIGVYDFGDAGGMPYIVMEFVSGESLYHAFHRIQVAPEKAVTIVKGICDGLSHAHSQGIIHRDIKPANVLLTQDNQPKIGDFGLARPAGKDDSGVVMGTPGYVAPEVLNRPDLADKRSDLFAVGVILYELLTGLRAPFENTPPASTLCGCDIALDRICERAMNPVAALRYQSADELSSDLGEWLARQAKPAAHPAAGASPVSGPRRQGAPVSRRAVVYTRTSGSGSSGNWLLALLALGAVGFLVWKFVLQPETPAKDGGKNTRETTRRSGSPSAVSDGVKTRSSSSRSQENSSTFGERTASSDQSGGSTPFGNPTPPADDSSDQVSRRPRDRGRSPDSSPQETVPQGPPPAEIVELDGKAKVLIGNLVQKRNKALTDNARNLSWDMDLWLKNLSKSEREDWDPEVRNLKSSIQGNRVPVSSQNALPEKLVKIASEHATKQKTIDEAFHSQAERIRSFYVERMVKLSQSGDKKTVGFASARARAAEDLAGWLGNFGHSLPPVQEEIHFSEKTKETRRSGSSVFGEIFEDGDY